MLIYSDHGCHYNQDEEKEQMDDDESDPWKPLREKVGEDLKEPNMKEVQQFLDGGKTQNFSE